MGGHGVAGFVCARSAENCPMEIDGEGGVAGSGPLAGRRAAVRRAFVGRGPLPRRLHSVGISGQILLFLFFLLQNFVLIVFCPFFGQISTKFFLSNLFQRIFV